MRKLSLMKTMTISCFIFVLLLCGQKNAFAAFDVDWGISNDSGLVGSEHLAQWLVFSGYFGNVATAKNFAETGYIGYGAGDADPFSWGPGAYNAQIVYERAGHQDTNTLGYFTGSGGSKTLTQIFNGTQNGPAALTIGQSFGLYLAGIEQELWFTSRGEHTAGQTGSLKDANGNPQGLIYALPGQEWLVAWEDEDASRLTTDRDYNDMYVTIKSQAIVTPEPISSVLFLLGGGMLAGMRLRKKHS